MDSFKPSWLILMEPLLPRTVLVAASKRAARPSVDVMMRLTSAGLAVNALSSSFWSSFNWPVLGSIAIPRSASERSAPSDVTTCSALDMDDWMPRAVLSPVRAWLVSAATSNAVSLPMVLCSEL
ncbi:hypothetical protein D9M68_709300 [compost metagenome]